MSGAPKTPDFRALRGDFPILSETMNGKPLAYLDSAATSQKPLRVLDAEREFYSRWNANVHRGAYLLSQEATDRYEGVREKVCRLLGTSDTREIIHTRGATESLNLVASCWGREHVGPGDDVVVTRMEHHSNFVPWQQLAREKGARFRIVELTPDGRIDPESLKKALDGRPKVLAFTMMSNVLGTLNPVAEIASVAREKGALVVVDAAQSVPSRPVRIPDLGAVDFLAFSSHKMCGPTGVGVLWGRRPLLESMRPWTYGGDMIARVEDAETRWNELPWKFEAGTPNFAGVYAFGEAVDYLMEIGMENVRAHEEALTAHAITALEGIDGVRVIGPGAGPDRGPAVSFAVEGVHPHDLATFLDTRGIAVRAGHHCAQPLMATLGVPATVRASFYLYNTTEEADRLAAAVREAREYFS